MASETYYRNLISDDPSDWDRHCASDIETQARARLVVGPLDSLLARQDLLGELKNRKVDLVAGGPPCQGFSLAGRRNQDDPRNRLAWEFLNFVDHVRPRFVLIENVVGMDTKFRNGAATSPFKDLKIALRELGYQPHGVLLNSVHYGAPQSRPRLMIIGVQLPIDATLDPTADDNLWKSRFVDELDLESLGAHIPRPTVHSSEATNVGEAIADLGQTRHKPLRASRHEDFLAEMQDSSRWPPLAPKTKKFNTALRSHRPHTKELFRLLQILTKLNLLREARKAKQANFDDEATKALSARLTSSAFPSASPDRKLRISSSADLLSLIESHLTRKHSQTVLDWNKPSRTVVTIPDDYIHPKEPRTFSVRELARFQGFPDSFVFHGKVTTGGTSRRIDVPQYTQVGNAVSPYISLAIGRMINRLVEREHA